MHVLKALFYQAVMFGFRRSNHVKYSFSQQKPQLPIDSFV